MKITFQATIECDAPAKIDGEGILSQYEPDHEELQAAIKKTLGKINFDARISRRDPKVSEVKILEVETEWYFSPRGVRNGW